MANWVFEQGPDGYVVWYCARGVEPVRCGEGPLGLMVEVLAWVYEAGAEPWDSVRANDMTFVRQAQQNAALALRS